MRFLRLLGATVVCTLVLYTLGTVAWYAGGQRWQPASGSCTGGASDQWVHGGRECLHMRVYRGATVVPHPDLIVVLHGDAPFPGAWLSVRHARPCDLGLWRRHMFAMQHQIVWWMPIHSLSPSDLAASVDPRTTVTVIVGNPVSYRACCG